MLQRRRSQLNHSSDSLPNSPNINSGTNSPSLAQHNNYSNSNTLTSSLNMPSTEHMLMSPTDSINNTNSNNDTKQRQHFRREELVVIDQVDLYTHVFLPIEDSTTVIFLFFTCF